MADRPVLLEGATAPDCPRHKTPMDAVENGTINGVEVTYWQCRQRLGNRHATPCPEWEPEGGTWWRDDDAQREYRARGGIWPSCRCHAGMVCGQELRTSETAHEEPDLFGGAA